MMFAKLFGSDDSQILVMLKKNAEDFPEVRVFFQPDGFDVCNVGFSWDDDSDESFDKADKCFAEFTEERARETVDSVLNNLLSGECIMDNENT